MKSYLHTYLGPAYVILLWLAAGQAIAITYLLKKSGAPPDTVARVSEIYLLLIAFTSVFLALSLLNLLVGVYSEFKKRRVA